MAESVVLESTEESELDVFHELLVDVTKVFLNYLPIFTCHHLFHGHLRDYRIIRNRNSGTG